MSDTTPQPPEPTLPRRLPTDGKRSPMSYPGHPAYELMKGKDDIEITADVKAMITNRTSAELFLWLVEFEAMLAAPGDSFNRTQADLAAVMGCSVKTVSRAAKQLEPLVRMTRRPRYSGSSGPEHGASYLIDWNEFLASMRMFYSRHARLQRVKPRTWADLSAEVQDTMTDQLLMVLKTGHRPPRKTRRPIFPERTSGKHERLESMYVEEAGMFKGLASAGNLLTLIRRNEYNPALLAERIIQSKFDILPDELTEWLKEITPGMTRSDLYHLAEATFLADFLHPLQIIELFERIPPHDDEQAA